MKNYFDLLKNSYVPREVYRTFSFDWIFENYFMKMNSLVNSMCDWLESFYYNLQTKKHIDELESGKINNTLRDFNKAVIKRIEEYRKALSLKRKTNIDFNTAAVSWIEKEYKLFRDKWFKEHCDYPDLFTG
jgi:hypothetical protein